MEVVTGMPDWWNIACDEHDDVYCRVCGNIFTNHHYEGRPCPQRDRDIIAYPTKEEPNDANV